MKKAIQWFCSIFFCQASKTKAILLERAEKLNQLGTKILTLSEHVIHQQTLMEAMYDIIPALIFCKDTDNNVLYINTYGAELWGGTPQELVGKGWMSKLIDATQADKYLANDIEVIKTGKAKMNILEPLVSDPNRIFMTHKLPMIKDGIVIGVIGFSAEITESLRSVNNAR